jgi:hypothetical protein
LDLFVRVSQQVSPARTPRQQLNEGEYAFRNGDLAGALALYERAWADSSLGKEDFGESKADPIAFAKFRQAMILGLLGQEAQAQTLLAETERSGDGLARLASVYARSNTGQDGALRGWIAAANEAGLYQLIYEGKAGNLDFPFEASEVYLQGGIVSSFLNTHPGADRDPARVWTTLAALGFEPALFASADLNGDTVNEFLFATNQGGATPNEGRAMWFVYNRENAWRVRRVDYADALRIVGETVSLPDGTGRAFVIELPEAYVPDRIAFTWDGAAIHWLGADTLEPRTPGPEWPVVGGGVLDDDF